MNAALLEQLRSARLSRQRSASDVDRLVQESVGLHSTDYASPYLSCWARIPEFDAADLFRRLNTGDGLVRVNAVRNTVHVVHVADLPLVIAATGPAVATVGRRSLRALTDAEVRAGVARLQAALEGGPLGSAALKAAVPDLAVDMRSWLLIAMGEGEVIRADTPHARSNRSRYALTRSWVSAYAGPELPAAEARRRLIGRAVAAFGPVTEADLAWWLPATKAEVARALADLGADARMLVVDGVRYWYATDLADAPAPARESHGAWLLPYEDGLLKGYQDRSWCLTPGLREVIFPYSIAHWHPHGGGAPGPGPHGGVNTSGEARPSIWWAGRVVGRWEEHADGVVWRVHGEVGVEGRAGIAAEVARLDRFLTEELRPIS